MLAKIENLNKNIDKLMNEKMKADAQKEVWEKRLIESINGYKEAYGVDLSDKSFAAIKEKLAREVKQVEAQTAEEYAKAQKIVTLIENGDIKGAWKEIGVEIEEKPEVVEVEEVAPVKQEGLQGVSSDILDMEEDDFDDSDLFGKSEEVVKEVAPKKSFTLDDEDDDDDDFVVPTTNQVKSISFDDDDDDDFVIPDTKAEKKSSTLVLDDDDDDDDPYSGGFGGFGEILTGSKFSPKSK